MDLLENMDGPPIVKNRINRSFLVVFDYSILSGYGLFILEGLCQVRKGQNLTLKMLTSAIDKSNLICNYEEHFGFYKKSGLSPSLMRRYSHF
jgi:hypothetical protein